MKKLILLLSATILMLFVACDEMDDIMQVTFHDVKIDALMDIPLSDFTSRTISLTADMNEKQFTDTTFISLALAQEATDSSGYELKDYLDKVDSVEITSFTIQLPKEFIINDSTMTLPDGFKVNTLNLTIANASDTIYQESFSDIEVNQDVETQFNDSILKVMAKVLADNKELTFLSSGSVSGSDDLEYFTLESIIISEVKVSVASVLGL